MYNPISGPLFVVAEHTEAVTTSAIERLPGLSDLKLAFVPVVTAVVTLKKLLVPDPEHRSWPTIIESDRLSPDDSLQVVVQLDEAHTVTIPHDAFVGVVHLLKDPWVRCL